MLFSNLTFSHCTCLVSVQWKYLALGRLYDLLCVACSSYTTLWEYKAEPMHLQRAPTWVWHTLWSRSYPICQISFLQPSTGNLKLGIRTLFLFFAIVSFLRIKMIIIIIKTRDVIHIIKSGFLTIQRPSIVYNSVRISFY